tara:strand:- start:110 stop:802 length:693 start_codon:yes stop_codon:yes gene_type:complete
MKRFAVFMFTLAMASADNFDTELDWENCDEKFKDMKSWTLDLYGCRYKNARNLYAASVKEFKSNVGPFQASMAAYKIATGSYTKAIAKDEEMPIFRRHLDGDIDDAILKKLREDNTLNAFENEFNDRRKAYLKSAKTMKLSTSPYHAARDAYVGATKIYSEVLNNQHSKRRLKASTIQSNGQDYVHNFELEAPELKHLSVLQDSYWKTSSSESKYHTVENIWTFMEDHRM